VIGLAMQEPQYRSSGVRELLDAIGVSEKVPCMSIMNMAATSLREAPFRVELRLRWRPPITDPTVWENFDPATVTLCSPDPQAVRPP